MSTSYEEYEDDEEMVLLGDALDEREARRAAGKRVRGGIGLRLTDTGNAERWAATHGRRFRMHTDRQKWFVWDVNHWRPDDESEALLSTKEVARDLVIHAAGAPPDDRLKIVKWANQTESSSRRAAMLAMAVAEPGISANANAWDADPWALNCLNCTVDLRTGGKRAHDPEDLHSKLAPVVYDPDALCPRFDQFLAEILPDPEVRSWLQRFFGYSITGVVQEHVFPVLWGPVGRNGKGTLIETLFGVLGPYVMPVPTELIIESKNEPHPNMKAQLLGARLAVAAEIKSQDRLAESSVKTLSGGDSIRARFLGKEFFTFEPTHKLLLQANFKPRASGDPALWARMRIVPFTVSFIGREDVHLKTKLAEERSGILRWLVEGCLAWQEQGLGTAKAIEDATNEYREDSDTLGGFIGECCVRVPTAHATAAEIYRAYETWIEARGEHAKSMKALSSDLVQMGFKRDRKRMGTVYVGIGVAEQGPHRNAAVTHVAGQQAVSNVNGPHGTDPATSATSATSATEQGSFFDHEDDRDDDDRGWRR